MAQLENASEVDIQQIGITRLVAHFVNLDVSYRLFVPEHDKYLEYQTIQDLLDGVSSYYGTYLPENPLTAHLQSGVSIIRWHVEMEQQVQDLSMNLSEL
jgi:hypothetical protein